MNKKIILFILIALVLFSFPAVSAAEYTKEADMLNSMGLFYGTQNGYELDRVPTRVESAAMLVRLLGAENEAKEMKFSHPFTDVPEWANDIVGYMYEKGYTKGIGDNLFGSNQTTIARDYTTFMLRSLGYGDSDFDYMNALNFAVTTGIILPEEAEMLNTQTFKRDEMVLISYRALKVPLKDDSLLLAEKLVDKGVITAQSVMDAGVAEYEYLSIRVYQVNGKLKVDYYLSRLNTELEKLNLTSSSFSQPIKFTDIHHFAKSSILTDLEKKSYSRWEFLDFVSDLYPYTIFRFYDDNLVMRYYCIIHDDLGEGDYKIVIQPVSNELYDSILKYEEEFREFYAEKIKKIGKIPSRAYTIEEWDGRYFISFDRSKLPASMKNVAHMGQSGESDSDFEDDLERTLKGYYFEPEANRYDEGFLIDEGPFELRYTHTYNSIALFDENDDIVGIAIIDFN